MLLLEKFEFLVKSYGTTEHKFLKKYYVRHDLMKKLRNGYCVCNEDVERMCEILEFDVEDFLNNSSSLSHQLKEGEHFIKKRTIIPISKDVVLEDYPHEDNSRYEEKD